MKADSALSNLQARRILSGHVEPEAARITFPAVPMLKTRSATEFGRP